MSLRSLLQRLFESEDTTNLRERVETIEVGWRRLQEEWTEVYNKFRTMQLRVAKQVQRLDADSSQEEPQGAGSDEILTGSAGPGLSLSPRQRTIQRQILERRRRGNGAPVVKEGGE